MKMPMHKGVGTIITNESRTHFFLQQKDETYPIEKFRNCYSFWGGKQELEDENSLAALKRELSEEIQIFRESEDFDFRFIKEFRIKNDNEYNFSFFELLLPQNVFDELIVLPVNEGRGNLLGREDLLSIKWIWGLEEVIQYYLMDL